MIHFRVYPHYYFLALLSQCILYVLWLLNERQGNPVADLAAFEER